MFESSATSEVLARAMDVCALRHAVYTANIANANVEGYRRLEVLFDAQAMRTEATNSRSMFGPARSGDAATQPTVVSANTTVKLDEEMATMARNALRYQTLLGAYERSMSLLQLAVHEGRGA
jgi:flagellar basal-body rod protein FlgB